MDDPTDWEAEVDRRFARDKRHRPRNYQQYKDSDDHHIRAILQMLPQMPPGKKTGRAIRKMSEYTHVPITTIRNWHRKKMEDAHWVPSRAAYGQHRCYLLPDEEIILQGEVEDKIAQGGIVTPSIIATMARQFYFERIARKRPIKKNAVFSDRWVRRWLLERGLSVRLAHAKRRPPVSQAAEDAWTRSFVEKTVRFDPEHVINMDETHVQALPNHLTTVTYKGADSVRVHINGNEKESITLLGSCTMKGRKLRLVAIGKGKTARCHQQYGWDKELVKLLQNQKGWTNEEAMIGYLRFLREPEQFPDQSVRLLVLSDSFSAHMTQAVLDVAEELNIELDWIPRGATPRLQPMDKVIFGVFKRLFRQEWYALAEQEISQPALVQGDGAAGGGVVMRCDRAGLAICAMRAWDRIRSAVILAGWRHFEIAKRRLVDPEFDPADLEIGDEDDGSGAYVPESDDDFDDSDDGEIERIEGESGGEEEQIADVDSEDSGMVDERPLSPVVKVLFVYATRDLYEPLVELIFKAASGVRFVIVESQDAALEMSALLKTKGFRVQAVCAARAAEERQEVVARAQQRELDGVVFSTVAHRGLACRADVVISVGAAKKGELVNRLGRGNVRIALVDYGTSGLVRILGTRAHAIDGSSLLREPRRLFYELEWMVE